MTVPTSGAAPVDDHFPGAGKIPTECVSCTAPTDGAGLCSFCADPPPPLDDPVADALIRCANYTELARLDVDKLIAELPADVPLWATVDLVAARAHLAAAIKKLDTAATRITDAEVAR